MRVLVLGVDWHGDVAPALCRGFQSRGIEAVPRHLLIQRRRALRPRIEDELLSSSLGPAIRRLHERRALAATRSAVASVAPDLTVCLAPELMPAPAIELAAEAAEVCWWFADDPLSFARRRLPGPPPVLDHIATRGGRAFVAHPAWARGPLAAATYLPYGARYEPDLPAYADPHPRRGCAVVGSPRRERAELLAPIAAALGTELSVWGWGARGRLPSNAATKPFRASLRGWGVAPPGRTETIYRSAAVVLNLQDPQMLGAWNPQTFDLMGLGVPQVVWNRDPVAALENPPPFASAPEELVELVKGFLRDPPPVDALKAAFEEVRARHRWRHRAEAITAVARVG